MPQRRPLQLDWRVPLRLWQSRRRSTWVLGLRLGRAEELLETTDLPVEEIARLVGYGSAAVLREQFVRRRGVPPRTYRRTFTRTEAPDAKPGRG